MSSVESKQRSQYLQAQLTNVMKRLELWNYEPSISSQAQHRDQQELDFFQWLQFVYLSNDARQDPKRDKEFIILRLRKSGYAGTLDDELLKLFVELDSL